jgi:hypothetical protein
MSITLVTRAVHPDQYHAAREQSSRINASYCAAAVLDHAAEVVPHRRPRPRYRDNLTTLPINARCH